MSVNEVKRKILESLQKAGRPLRPKEAAQLTGYGTSSLTMHLLWLKKSGHVFTPQQGHYSLTKKGMEALGRPKIDKDKARGILNRVKIEQAFHFYTEIDKYTGIYACDLAEFCDMIPKMDPTSVEFHMGRRDFESWFQGLGDIELAKKMKVIRETGVSGKKLREQVYRNVKSHCNELQSLSEAKH